MAPEFYEYAGQIFSASIILSFLLPFKDTGEKAAIPARSTQKDLLNLVVIACILARESSLLIEFHYSLDLAHLLVL